VYEATAPGKSGDTPIPWSYAVTDDNQVVERAGWAPLRHFAERSVLGLIAVAAIGLGFGALLLLVRLHWSPLLHLDQSVAEGLNHRVSGSPSTVKALQTISTAGGRGFLIPLVTIVIVLLLIRRRPRLAIYLAVTGLGAMLLDPSLKTLVGRIRPVVDAPVAHAPGNSFPSGHALGSMITYGMLTLVFLSLARGRWRWLLVGLAALVVAAIGFSRIALGVHFLSDVLAGWLLGIAWISATAYAFRVWRREAGHANPPLSEGLEPEAAADLSPAPAEGELLPHPWAKGAEILVGWVLTFGLLYVVGYALTRWSPGTWLGRFDDGVPQWLQTFRTPSLDHLSWLGSKAGDTHAILLISLVFCPIALALWRQWRPVLFLVLTMLGEITLFLCSAAAVGRPRPDAEQLDGQMPTSSFPSGHIAATMCVWAAIAILSMGRIRQWWRWVFLALAVLMPAAVALSRMYRGMHHPTDVLGAALLSACWLSVLWWTVRPNAHAETVTEAAAEAAAVAAAPVELAVGR
jgi:membrane-associated phospholipid phosphatase